MEARTDLLKVVVVGNQTNQDTLSQWWWSHWWWFNGKKKEKVKLVNQLMCWRPIRNVWKWVSAEWGKPQKWFWIYGPDRKRLNGSNKVQMISVFCSPKCTLTDLHPVCNSRRSAAEQRETNRVRTRTTLLNTHSSSVWTLTVTNAASPPKPDSAETANPLVT